MSREHYCNTKGCQHESLGLQRACSGLALPYKLVIMALRSLKLCPVYARISAYWKQVFIQSFYLVKRNLHRINVCIFWLLNNVFAVHAFHFERNILCIKFIKGNIQRSIL